MKDKLISFETATLAKKRGFDWKCNNYHDKRDGYYLDNVVDKNYNETIGCISIPTQTLLQKWLREEHKIVVSPDIFNTEEFKLYWAVGIIFIENLEEENFTEESRPNFQLPDMFNTYEKALEKGILEALKLIK